MQGTLSGPMRTPVQRQLVLRLRYGVGGTGFRFRCRRNRHDIGLPAPRPLKTRSSLQTRQDGPHRFARVTGRHPPIRGDGRDDLQSSSGHARWIGAGRWPAAGFWSLDLDEHTGSMPVQRHREGAPGMDTGVGGQLAHDETEVRRVTSERFACACAKCRAALTSEGDGANDSVTMTASYPVGQDANPFGAKIH